jgi:hypothetical protein
MLEAAHAVSPPASIEGEVDFVAVALDREIGGSF